jgi:murein hydrolase activator
MAAAAAPAESPDAAEAKAKLAAVREHIAALTNRIAAQLKERDALNARVREAELAITAKRLRLDALNAQAQAAERQRSDLRAAEAHDRAALDAERAALGAQVRAQYMIGRADELRLLLSQTSPAEVGRVLAYYGYFARARADKIADIAAHQAHLDELVAQVEDSSAKLKSLQDDTAREVAALVRARQERAQAPSIMRSKAATNSSRGCMSKSRRWSRWSRSSRACSRISRSRLRSASMSCVANCRGRFPAR